MLDLDAIREMISPLDLTPRFAVVAGAHLYGIAAPDSQVVVRGAHAAALSASLGPGRRTAVVDLELLDRGISLRYVSEDLPRIARRIGSGDGVILEALASPHVLSGGEELAELRSISRAFLTRRIHRYYRSLARRALRRIERDRAQRVLGILAVFRALLAGIHALEEGEILPDLGRLVGIHGVPWVTSLLPPATRTARLGDPARAGFLLEEARGLFERLDRAAERTKLPSAPPDPAPLDHFVAARLSG